MNFDLGKRDYPAFIDKPFSQDESFRYFARRVREFLDEKSKQHRQHTIIAIGWRLSPATFAHICHGVSFGESYHRQRKYFSQASYRIETLIELKDIILNVT